MSLSLSLWQRLRSLRHWRDFWFRHLGLRWRYRQLRTADVEVGLPEPVALSPVAAAQAATQAAELRSADAPWPALPNLAERESLTVASAVTLLQAAAPACWTQQPTWASLDIGSKNASYALGLAYLAQHLAAEQAQLQLTAIELDGGRRYRDGFCRADYGLYFMAQAQQWLQSQRLSPCEARFIVGDLRQHQGRYDLVTWLMPFVFADPHLAWGLPLRYFNPVAHADHVLQQLKRDGLLLVVNLNPQEWQMMGTHLRQVSTPHRIVSEGAWHDRWLYPEDQRQYRLIQRL